jgi:hypothetical protein
MLNQIFRSRRREFQVRSEERDLEVDRASVHSIDRAINEALERAVAEQTGLGRRIDDVLARAAIAAGNEVDEYLSRSPEDNKMLSASEDEIRRGQKRLATLDQNIAHFKFLKIALQTRFPDFIAAG